METALETLCHRCGAPFESCVKAHIPMRDGSQMALSEDRCLSCRIDADRERAAAAKAAKGIREFKTMAPIPQPDVTVNCLTCGQPFTTDAVLFKGDGKRLKDTLSHATVCEACETPSTTPQDEAYKLWI